MTKPLSLFVALLLMSSGWAAAFLLASNPSASQSYWLIPALTIGMAIGLCLRFINGKRVALLLALTAAIGLASVNQFFPENRVSLESARSFFSGDNPQRNLKQLIVAERFQTPPFDEPMTLTSPVSLELSLFARLPAGVADFCFSSEGALYASLPGLGAVYRVRTTLPAESGAAELFLHSLNNPSGMACNANQLLVSVSSQILAFPYTGGPGKLLIDRLPDDGGELSHHLLQTSAGLLFSIGSRCDACNENDPLRGTVQLLGIDGRLHPYAKGLRNLGGLSINVMDGSIWVTERSRLYPEPGAADELNCLRPEADYGWPLCDGNATTEALESLCRDATLAEVKFQSRANPTGLIATSTLSFPLVYKDSLLVVLQGDSKYSIVPAVVRLQFSEGKVGEPVAFLGGWDGKTARPSAIQAGPDGAIYIADEINGAIYRAAWHQPN